MLDGCGFEYGLEFPTRFPIEPANEKPLAPFKRRMRASRRVKQEQFAFRGAAQSRLQKFFLQVESKPNRVHQGCPICPSAWALSANDLRECASIDSGKLGEGAQAEVQRFTSLAQDFLKLPARIIVTGSAAFHFKYRT